MQATYVIQIFKLHKKNYLWSSRWVSSLHMDIRYIMSLMGVARIFFGGGNTFSKKFSKNIQQIFKKYSKKILKNSKNFKNIQKIFQKFSKKFRKFLIIFLRKLLKMDYFSLVFSQLNKARGQFLRVWMKSAICRKFLRKFSKIFSKFPINWLFRPNAQKINAWFVKCFRKIC